MDLIQSDEIIKTTAFQKKKLRVEIGQEELMTQTNYAPKKELHLAFKDGQKA